jgi:FHA domain
MTTHLCPKGHISTELDYCSECGSKIQAIDSLAAVQLAPPQDPATTIPCPACGAPHHADDGNFCEICGYNFSTGQAADLSVATLPPPMPIATPIAPAVVEPPNSTDLSAEIESLFSQSTSSPTGWQITIRIDPSLALAESPPAPTQAPIDLPLKQSTSLIGRTSAAKGVTPDISLDFDDAVSHRHALLIVQENGNLVVRDIGSSNGVQFKGQDLAAMADIPLQSGDIFSLGHWTAIEVKRQ